MINRRTDLTSNVVDFCRFLRSHDFRIGSEEEATALRAMSLVTPDDRSRFALALQVALTHNAQQVQQFPELFDQYWKELEKAVDSKTKDSRKKNGKQNGTQQPSFDALKSWLNGQKNNEETETASHSITETLSQKDFSLVPADQLAELVRIIQEVSQALARKLNRRREKSHSAQEFDLKNTLRRNLRRGGELVELVYKRPRRNRVRLVVLADVSKSMDLYSTFLIQFLYAFQSVFRRIETFVFSTQLHHVTADLKQQSFQEALRELSEHTAGWSGGTRIGPSLWTFANDYGRLLNRETLVIILSDGWDTGDPNVLAEAMQRIQQKSCKVIWLNPLAGNPTYQPRTAAMQAVLPYVDVFASAHNIESLKALGKWL
ncbi:vWA domain-containing protein [Telluribacter humicola]|uniref:vWA domain-containing protein n=1 Tax=Telluribacter humicola TaxID=1720261 RepID=UPI001A964C1A|nr:VWA domain-containing protein [Telluribacter humicola]